MKKHIQLINLKLIFTLLFCISYLFGQVRPHQPPTHPIMNFTETIEIKFAEKNAVNPSISFHSISENNGQNIYQIKIQTDSKKELILEIENAIQGLDDYYFIRYENGGYIGPIFSNELLPKNKLIISGINPNDFIVEYITSVQENYVLPVISKIYKNIYSITKKDISKVNYWKRTREEPTVLLTGFWPPTNEMIRHFSQNLELNPDGWVGDNWEDRGYNIIGYFPQFENPDCSNCGIGYGDLEVDYQYTSEDFWTIVEEIEPIAIITFSRGNIDYSWELENNYYNRTNWIQDYLPPNLPTPNPPDGSVENYFERNSNLPMEIIEDAVENAGLGLNAWIDWQGHPGQFVSEFMGYHGVWYRDINQDSDNICHFAGHVHVGGLIDWDTAREATNITVREVLNHLDELDYTSGDVNEDSFINVQDLLVIVQIILGNQVPSLGQFLAADLNSDDIINVQDIILIINIILGN